MVCLIINIFSGVSTAAMLMLHMHFLMFLRVVGLSSGSFLCSLFLFDGFSGALHFVLVGFVYADFAFVDGGDTHECERVEANSSCCSTGRPCGMVCLKR